MTIFGRSVPRLFPANSPPVSTSWTSRLANVSPRPRLFQAHSFVATSGAGVVARISAPEPRATVAAVEIASSYHGLEKPRMSRSVGITSRTRVRSALFQRQMTGSSIASRSPRSRSLAPSRWYSTRVATSQIHIDVVGGAGGRRAGLGDPKVDRRTTDEDDLVYQRAEDRGSRLELRRAHGFATEARERSLSARRPPATLRTRASPSRRLSSRARNSPSPGQPSIASGAAGCSGSIA